MIRWRTWLLPALLAAAQLALWPGLELTRGNTIDPVRGAAAVAVIIVIAAALGWRRRAPVAGTVVVAAGISLGAWVVPGDGLFGPGSGLFLISLTDLVALFSVAALRSRRTTLVVFAGLSLWQAALLAANGFTGDYPGDLVISVGCYALVAAAGRIRGRWVADRSAAARRLAEAQAARREAAATERRRLARELHDVTAHHLTSIVVTAAAAQMLADQRPELRAEALDFASRTGQETLVALRRLVAILPLGEDLPAPPTPSLADLADDFRQLGQLVTVETTGDAPAEVTEAIHGIAREALTNTLRYAPGSAVRLRFSAGPNGAELLIDDDGDPNTGHPRATNEPGHNNPSEPQATDEPSHNNPGQPRPSAGRDNGDLHAGQARPAAGHSNGDPSAGQPRATAGLGGGRGLIGMRERAQALGGTLDAGPRGERGWRVHAALPLTAPPVPHGSALLRRWLRSQVVLDAGLVFLTLVLPLSGVAVVVEDDGLAPARSALVLLAVLAHSVPLLWRRQHPWPVLAAVASTTWLGPLLMLTHVPPGDGGWLFLFSVGADLVAVYTVAALIRPGRSWLAPVIALVSTALALGLLLSFGPAVDADAETDGPMGYALLFGAVSAVMAIALAVPVGGSWLAGYVTRRRRQHRLNQEEGAVAVAAGQAEMRARDERARVAAGLREAVVEHAARVPRAADEADLVAVLEAARQALAAMRALLDGLGERHPSAATQQEVPSSPSV